jgi:rare lipoprotein A
LEIRRDYKPVTNSAWNEYMKTIFYKPMMLVLTGLLINGCSVSGPLPSSEAAINAAVEGDGPGDPALLNRDQLVVRNLPKSRSGNRPQYTVFGETYKVLDTAKDFTEWGEATWYGEKFHGRATASGEIYDMHLLTAAHRNLPLPTFVRVTRIDTDRSVVVKVNDRGPFVDDRIIDLSYAAAAKLDIIEDGKAEVYVEALSSHEGAVDEKLVEIDDSTGPQAKAIRTSSVSSNAVAVAGVSSADQVPYVQAGAFSERGNAERMMSRLKAETELPVVVDFEGNSALYRVRVGPLNDSQKVQQALDVLAGSGIKGYTVMAPAR